MKISEILVDANKQLLDQIRHQDSDLFYIVYLEYQKVTTDFSQPAKMLYDNDHIYTVIYYLVDGIDKLEILGFPNDSQIMIALNELLDYFNR